MRLTRLFKLRLACALALPVRFFTFASFSLVAGQDGVRINEILAVNEDGKLDSDGDPSDWIEIFNAGAQAVDLTGYTLTDDLAVPAKWKLPAGTSLGAGGYLLVFASGKDRAVAGEELHTSFGLGRTDMYVGLFNAGQQEVHAYKELPEQREDTSYGLGVGGDTLRLTYVPDEASCSWLVPTEDIGSDWQQPAFDDGTWTAAKLGLGFDYDAITGENGNLKSAMQGVNASVFVRVPFEVENPARVVSLKFSMRFEDGFVAFLNGNEVASMNRPEPLDWESKATSSHPDRDAIIPVDFELTSDDFSGRLVAGTNILAVHGMNSSRGGSDALVYPNLVGEVTAAADESEGFFSIPTPGTTNSNNVAGFVSNTTTEPIRGFYEQAIEVKITNATAGAEIYYTLDQTEPTRDDGTPYTGPIPISETTVLRVAAFRTGFAPSRIDTHTYIFLDDVVTHDALRRAPSSDEDKQQMRDALVAIPTISVVATDTRELHKDAARQRVEPQPEQPCSAEWINPDGSEGFQINAGVARFGGFYTVFGGSGERSKKQWRLYFRKKYGKPTLQYPVFDGFEYDNTPPVEEFDALALRSGSHDMVARGAYMSNRFADDTLLDMGSIAPHGRFVHVYINGDYWGQYHLRERWHAAMFARYFGGAKEDYEAIDADNSGGGFQTGHVYDGTGEIWDAARDLIRDGARVDDTYNFARTHIDINGYIDFMVTWGSGQSESEFRSAGGALLGDTPDSPLRVPFQFFLKDADGYLRGATPGRATHEGPVSLYRELRRDQDPEFLTLIGDRLHKHFFNDGAMTPDRQVERLQKRIDEIAVAFHAEAARWNFRTHSSWESTVRSSLRSRASAPASVLRGYERADLYPEVVAPVFSQHGGTIPANGEVQITADGLIYFTVDGSDPRLPGGAFNPSAVTIDGRGQPVEYFSEGAVWKYLDDGSEQGTAWRGSGFDDSSWAEGAGEFGYGDRDEATVVSFGESAARKFITTYFRKVFNASEVERQVGLTVHLLRDDGAIVYINGQEVVRDNLPAGEVTSTTPAGDDKRDEDVFYVNEVEPSLLVNGQNVIAVEVHNESERSSDLSFDLKLDGLLSTGTPTVNLAGPTTLKARVLDGDQWSALNQAFFSPAAATPTKDNLVISEFMYNPADPTEAERAAGVTNADRLEFIELLNIGGETLNLAGVEFTDGIGARIAIGDSAFVSAGDRVLLVKDPDAFAVRYGSSLPVIGTFTGNLRNSGENIELLGPNGMIRTFAYDDIVPWPVEADGSGPALVLIAPVANPDHAVAANWRASVPGGTPGKGGDEAPGESYAAWRSSVFTPEELADAAVSGDLVDAELDGLPVFLEFAVGGSPTSREFNLGLEISESGGELFLSYARNKTAAGIKFSIEHSEGLTAWAPADASLAQTEVVSVSNSSERVVLRYSGNDSPTGYFRLKVQ
jgi:hypothetical protein